MNIEYRFCSNSTRTTFFSHAVETGSAIMVRNGGADSLYYTYCDYQGNLMAVTDAAGVVKE